MRVLRNAISSIICRRGNHCCPIRAASTRSAAGPFSPFVFPRPAVKAKQVTHCSDNFLTESGQELPSVEMEWEQWGDFSLGPSRTVLLLPGFSVGSHAHSSHADHSPGWWEAMIGPGRPIDTNLWRVICVSPLGSPFGSTSPLSINPLTGRQYRLSFPQITVLDQAIAFKALLDRVGVTGPLHAIIGSSVGGMQALSMAAEFPHISQRLAVFCSTGQTSPYTVGLRRVQRQAILADPNFHNGNYADFGVLPSAGLRIAREIGMLTYKCREEYDARFDWKATRGVQRFDSPTFEVESYLQYQGNKFVSRYDPNCYLYMSRCAELMDLGRRYGSFAAGAKRIQAKTHMVAVEQDVLIHHTEMRRLHDAIPSSTLDVLSSPDGHDAFLTDITYFGEKVKSILEDGLQEQLKAESLHTTGLFSP